MIAVVQLQKAYGSRFFFPHKFRQYKHNYMRYIEDEYLPADVVSYNVPWCELCLGSLSTPGMINQEIDDKEYNRLKKRIGLYLETPCKHKFHYSCLYTHMINHSCCPKCSKLIHKLNEYDD